MGLNYFFHSLLSAVLYHTSQRRKRAFTGRRVQISGEVVGYFRRTRHVWTWSPFWWDSRFRTVHLSDKYKVISIIFKWIWQSRPLVSLCSLQYLLNVIECINIFVCNYMFEFRRSMLIIKSFIDSFYFIILHTCQVSTPTKRYKPWNLETPFVTVVMKNRKKNGSNLFWNMNFFTFLHFLCY